MRNSRKPGEADKKFKNKLKELIKNSTFSLLSNVFQLIVSLGSGIIIARSLGTSGKGEVFLINQIFGFVQVIFSFGFGPAIIYLLKKKELSLRKVNYFILLYCSVLAVIFILVVIFFNNIINVLIGGDLSLKLMVLTFIIGYINTLSGLLGYKILIHNNGIKYQSIAGLISNGAFVLLLVLTLLIFELGVDGVAYSLIGSALVRLLLYVIKKENVLVTFEKINLLEVNKLFKYGFYVFVTNFFLTSVFRIDTFFLNKMVSKAQLGLYSVSVNVSELLLLIPSAIGVALFPHLSGLDRKEQTDTMCLVGRVSFIIGFLGIVALSIIGYPFIWIVFGEDFLPAFVPFLFLLPGLMAMSVNYSYSNYFNSIGLPLVSAYIFSVGLIINVVLNLVLIPKFGISGAAISSSITYAFITIGFAIKIIKLDNLALKEFMIPKLSDYSYVIEKITYFLMKR